MDFDCSAILILSLLLLLTSCVPNFGYNRSHSIQDVINFITNGDFRGIHETYKSFINSLDKSAFNKFKVLGILARKKDVGDVSRGKMKLQDLLRQTRIKISGTILSLACGRGGWEQLTSAIPTVSSIFAVTYGEGPGHVGHENFSDRIWPGKEKIRIINTDIRKMHESFNPNTDWIMFDGGESRSKHTIEADKFWDLFSNGVMPYFHAGVRGFVLKILTPFDTRVIGALEEIRKMTKMGNLYVSVYTRQSNTEMYFISTPITCSLDKQARDLTKNKLIRALEDRVPEVAEREREHSHFRSDIEPDVELLQPLDTDRSIRELGPQLTDPGRNFLHWFSRGVYPFGNTGAGSTPRNPIIWNLVRSLTTTIHGLPLWGATNTTAEGFMKTFSRKIDTATIENGPHYKRLERVYIGMATYFKQRGYRYSKLNWEQLKTQANKQGAPGINDNYRNVGEALDDPHFPEIMQRCRDGLLCGQPTGAVARGIPKREKKENAESKSRMVSFYGIPMRMVEAETFGSILELTKPHINRFGVGGLGLHDLGERLREIYKESSVADDVAGFDTRVGLKIQSLECNAFMKNLCNAEDFKMVHALYRMYAYPLLLIPKPSEYIRSELIEGRGQRLSGTAQTYSMNTLTRLAVTLLQISDVENIHIDELISWTVRTMMPVKNPRWSGCISGDDQVISGNNNDILALSKNFEITNSLGFIRKDIPLNADSPISHSLEEVEFCSHRYSRVTYYNEKTAKIAVRWMPVRTYAEIFGKSSIWISGVDIAESQVAWAFAQANNLLVNYPHLRDCRRLGFAIRSAIPNNLMLGEHAKAIFMPRPWMRSGDVLDIINDCYFGKSTAYPMPGFRIHKWEHIGYVPLTEESTCNPYFEDNNMKRWRNEIIHIVDSMRNDYGGTGTEIRTMARYKNTVRI